MRDPLSRYTIAIAVLVGIATLAVRGLYLWSCRGDPGFDTLVLNARDYESWALHGFPAGEAYFQAPLYVYFLKGIYALVGAEHGRWATRWVQVLLDAGTALLVAGMATRLAGRAAGVAAGLLVAGAGSLVYFSGELLPATLTTFLLTAALASLLHNLRRASAAAEWNPGRWLGSGLLLGLTAACRPNFLLVGLALVATLALLGLRKRREEVAADPAAPLPFPAARRGWLLAASCVLAGIAVPVGVVTLRNLVVSGEPVLLTCNSGHNLFLGNHPDSDGIKPFPPRDVLTFMEEQARAGKSQAQRSRAAAERAREFIAADPARCAALACKRLVLFYHRAEIPNNRSIRQQTERSAVLHEPPVAWIGLALLLPLALAGLAAMLASPRLRAPALLLGAALLAAPVSVAPFLVCARFRAPLIPLLALAAGVLLGLLRERRSLRQRLGPAIALAAGALIAWPDWYGACDTDFIELAVTRLEGVGEAAWSAAQRGDAAAAQRDLEDVRSTLAYAERTFPGDPTLAVMQQRVQALARHLEKGSSR